MNGGQSAIHKGVNILSISCQSMRWSIPLSPHMQWLEGTKLTQCRASSWDYNGDRNQGINGALNSKTYNTEVNFDTTHSQPL